MNGIEVVNPFTGQVVGRVARGGAAEIDRAVREAAEGGRVMRGMPLHRRCPVTASGSKKEGIVSRLS
jgi:acyl-CoA reductase-like NAD-dependent aldehyde dehydrogenase